MWSGTSKLDLEHFLPGTQSITETFTLGQVAPGRYRVVLVVLDPKHYYGPLALAVAHRAFDGSYPIGSVVVRRADVTVSDRTPPADVPGRLLTKCGHWMTGFRAHADGHEMSSGTPERLYP